VSALAGIARFVYDFVVGDDWKIAAGVAVTVAAGAILAASVASGSAWVAPVVGSALAVAFVLTLIADVRG
jgi:hypothetical protein